MMMIILQSGVRKVHVMKISGTGIKKTWTIKEVLEINDYTE